MVYLMKNIASELKNHEQDTTTEWIENKTVLKASQKMFFGQLLKFYEIDIFNQISTNQKKRIFTLKSKPKLICY